MGNSLHIIIGAVVGGSCVALVVYLFFKYTIVSVEEEKKLIEEEKRIIIEFTHYLIEGIGEGIDQAELYKRIAHGAIIGTGAFSACVYELSDNKELVLMSMEGLFPPQKKMTLEDAAAPRAKFIEKVLRSENVRLGEGIAGDVAQTGCALLIADAEKDPRVALNSDPALKLTSLIMVPITFKKEVIGVLGVANPADGTPFDSLDLSLVQSLADQAGMAIHNAHLLNVQLEKNRMDFDLKLASSIQGMLLTKQECIHFPGLDVAVTYKAAQTVGGDLYEIVPLSDHQLAIAIADVSGKGVPASILMAICLTHLKHCVKKHKRPLQVMKALNRELVSQMHRGMFITMSYMVIDLKARTLTFCRAGHEDPIFIQRQWVSNTFVSRPLTAQGIAIGIADCDVFEESLEEKTVSLDDQAVLYLFTDGVTEVLSPQGEEFSVSRLERTIQENYEHSADGINEAVMAAVQEFSGKTTFQDDITCVCVKYGASSPCASD